MIFQFALSASASNSAAMAASYLAATWTCRLLSWLRRGHYYTILVIGDFCRLDVSGALVAHLEHLYHGYIARTFVGSHVHHEIGNFKSRFCNRRAAPSESLKKRVLEPNYEASPLVIGQLPDCAISASSNKKEKLEDKDMPHCPRCAAPLEWKKTHIGAYLGCPNYPKCPAPVTVPLPQGLYKQACAA
jgi:hypothetical protein